MNKIFVLSAILSAVAAQITITNPTDSRIINEIREDYDDFVRVANAAIADLMTKNNVAAEAAKNALNGQTTVPVTYNESTIKALLTAAPQILQYPAVWNVIDSNDDGEALDADDLEIQLIINEIREEYDDFVRAANAAIAGLMTKNNVAAEAAKNALNGQTTVPVTYNESTIKALLTAAPQILQYPAVWNVIDSNDDGEALDADDLEIQLIINEIREEYDDFVRAANAAIAGLMTKNNVAAEAAKNALNDDLVFSIPSKSSSGVKTAKEASGGNISDQKSEPI
ncbi:hypothetical protein BB561_006896, partial [Smittium simulii]